MSLGSIHIVDYIIICLSIILTVGMGVYFASKQKNTDSFFKASGKIPAWAIGISIMATLISSVTFIAYPGEGFSSNWIRLVQGLMVPVVLILIIGFVVPLFRKVIRLSAFEYFEHRFGFFARLYSSIAFVLIHFTKMGTVFYLLAMALSPIIEVDIVTIIWLVGISVLLLSILGGIEAVMWLDVIQGILLIVGGITALLIILFSVEGGPSTIWRMALDNDKIGFGPYDFEFVNLTFIVMALNGVFYAIQKYGTDQTIVQRYLTAKTDKEAFKASLIGVLLSVPVWVLFMFIGTALFSYYQISPGILPEGIKNDEVFPYFIMTELPVGVVGLILSALIAAAISSLDSDLNSISAVCLEDYFLRFKPNASQTTQLILSRIFILLSGFGSIGIALYYVRSGGEGVLAIVFTLYAIFSGGIAGMFLLGIFSKRANTKGLYFGIGACVIFTAYALLSSMPMGENNPRLILDLGRFNYKHHSYMVGVYSHIILFIVGYVASCFFKGKKLTEKLTYYDWKEMKKAQKLDL